MRTARKPKPQTVHQLSDLDGNATMCGRPIGGRVKWTAGYVFSGSRNRRVPPTCARCIQVAASRNGRTP